MLWEKKQRKTENLKISTFGLRIVFVKDLEVLVMFFLRVLARDFDPYS